MVRTACLDLLAQRSSLQSTPLGHSTLQSGSHCGLSSHTHLHLHAAELYAYFISVLDPSGWPLAGEKLYHAADLVQFPIKLLHGSVYKVHVRATNYAGLEAKFTTPLVIVDATAPIISYISDFGFPSEAVDIVRGPDLDLVVHFPKIKNKLSLA